MVELASEDSLPLTEDELRRLPLFPLPRAVFFPGTVLPLHLFEPRYRDMIEDCMRDGPRAMAVALLAPGWEEDYEGNPPVHPVAGAGRIVAHERCEDGTHNILLRGLHRVHLEELANEGKAYRLARATVVPDRGAARADDVRALWSCASTVAAVVRREHPEFTLGVRPDGQPSHLVDVVTDRLVAHPTLRQRILETADVGERVRLATDAVGELLSALREGSPGSN
ncbi:MAG: LON peptidase substrate-binding domain-containing protein [Myxococcota bacterium]